jgi:hypothetical protein
MMIALNSLKIRLSTSACFTVVLIDEEDRTID